MIRRRAAILGWVAVVTLCLESAVNIALESAAGRQPPLAPIPFGLTMTIVGALIVGRQPRNGLGWLFCAAPVLLAAGEGLAPEYARQAILVAPGSLPRPEIVAWLGGLAASIGFPSFGLALVLFPSGRPAGRAERLLAAAFVAMLGLNVVAVAFGASQVELASDLVMANPFALSPIVAAYGPLQSAVGVLFVGYAVGALANLGRRFRRSSGVERRQFQWFFVGAAIATLGNVAFSVLSIAGYGAVAVAIGLFPISTVAIPITIGIAVLRHRLYDIDLVIERTLVYGITTTGIAVAFFGGIVLLQAALRPITGGSELAVAVSTLASVALFQPLRRRIRSAVDRRFYRSRYDAGRTVDEFTVRLRDQVALEAVRADLIAVVRTSVQPAHASLWLRERPR